MHDGTSTNERFWAIILFNFTDAELSGLSRLCKQLEDDGA